MPEMDEEQKRKEAMKLHIEGKSPTEICGALRRSRKWFYKWLKRFESGAPDWFKEQSRAPQKVANKTAPEMEKEVLAIRSKLENAKHRDIGAFAIRAEMNTLKMKPLPEWTINRILKRHNVVREKKRYQPSGKAYPDVLQVFTDSVHQADLVGPRWIQHDGRFYSLNVIDMATRMAAIYPIRTKGDEDVANGLLHAWKTIGQPDYLQLDNELSFRGSNRYPRSLGLVLRMCLALRVQPIFIPVGEPWRNGIVEKFQDTFDKNFFRGQWFSSFKHLKEEAKDFERFRNEEHHHSSLGGKTPVEYAVAEDFSRDKLAEDVCLEKLDLSYLEDGQIHLIRFIRSDCRMDVFGEKFTLPASVKYEYVIASILTEIHEMRVSVEKEHVTTFHYAMPIEFEAQ